MDELDPDVSPSESLSSSEVLDSSELSSVTSLQLP